jgi:hypothetical protein
MELISVEEDFIMLNKYYGVWIFPGSALFDSRASGTRS